jgi:2-haloacid dehalogenase
MSGAYRPLPELLRAVLEREGVEDVDRTLERFAAMPAYPDAATALDTLRQAGVRAGVLSNSAKGAAESALTSAGLEVELVVGSDAVGVFKPDPRVYAAGVEATGAGPGEVVMVAAHWWDLLGASRAGLRTAWVARKEKVLMPGVEVDWWGADLAATAAAVAAG